jgi:hypothetical protein
MGDNEGRMCFSSRLSRNALPSLSAVAMLHPLPVVIGSTNCVL